ncbi:hypothetical protein FRC17_006406 [Serendipita sp. 399]|nr:hypothetical protein FRC17_006406 [Serendipita sp. 399]
MSESSTQSQTELALLTGTTPKAIKVPDFIEQISNCDFEAFFRSEHARNYLVVDAKDEQNGEEHSLDVVLDSLKLFKPQMEGYIDEMSRLSIGVAALHAFIQVNWTGPDLTFAPSDVIYTSDNQALSVSKTMTDQQLNSASIAWLALGGEPAYHLSKVATFLYIALRTFELPYQTIPSIHWWRLRGGRIHREVLDEPVIFSDADFPAVEEFANTYLPKDQPDVLGRYRIEKGLMHHLLKQDKLAADEFAKAANVMGLQYELTGVKGRKTKFQVADITQLVLLAKGRGREDSISDPTAQSDGTKPEDILPETLELNDDTLLETTQYTSTNSSGSSTFLSDIDPNNQPALHPLDQCVFLGLCLHVKNTSPQHGLTTEQMIPYVSRVIAHPQNWSVHTMSLLLRSRLEANRTRTVERSTLQLQALIDQMPTSDSTVPQRLQYFHQIALPSKWEMEKELALRMIGLGVLKSALEILERLEMWEEVVHCWQAMERHEQAIEVVKDLLQGRKEEADAVTLKGKANKQRVKGPMDRAREAKLWCILGELESDQAEEHFQKAWEVSSQTSGRAVRSLGGYYFARGKFAEAIDNLQKAVEIQPLLARSWFILGCALVREERWEEARDAFSRCVVLDEEDGESWNNLASVYLRLSSASRQKTNVEDVDPAKVESDAVWNNKRLAFRALQQGLKNSYSNWRMWSNYMVVSVDVGELAEACRALGRVVEERSEKDGKASVDVEVLERLISAVTRSADLDESSEKEARPSNPNEGLGLYARLDGLFTQVILPRVSDDGRIWKARAQLLTWRRRWGEAIDAYSAAYRCEVVSEAQLEVDLEKWREAVVHVEEYIDVLRNFGPKAFMERDGAEGSGKKKREGSWGFQARSVLRTFMGRTRDAFEDEPEWKHLEELEGEIKHV